MMIEIEPVTHISLPDLIARRKEIHARFMRASRFDAPSHPTPQQKLRAILVPPDASSLPETPPPDTQDVAATASPDMPLRPTIQRIIAEVAAFHEISVADMIGPDRQRRFLRPRQIACYLAKIFHNQVLSRNRPAHRTRPHHRPAFLPTDRRPDALRRQSRR